MPSRLPPLPNIHLTVLEDYTSRTSCEQGFLKLRRQMLSAHFPDGSESRPFAYDQAERVALDAVVIVAHYRNELGQRLVFLRSAIRPPVALRPKEIWPMPERPTLGQLWEVPAGLVEPSEQSELGLRLCAARELKEELGIQLRPEDMLPLGPATFPAPAVIGERHFYFHCEVDPKARTRPQGDGSPLEDFATIVALPLEDALDLVRKGEVEDAKTEIALRRLAEI